VLFFFYLLILPKEIGFSGIGLGFVALVLLLILITVWFFKDANTYLNTMPFVALTLFGCLFGIILLHCQDFITLYCSLEGLGLTTLFLLSRNYLRQGSKELFFKYFCFTSFSSLFLLLGISFFFFLTNTFDFLTIKLVIFNFKYSVLNSHIFQTSATLLGTQYSLYFIATLFIIVSFCFKIGAFPFHFVVPELYEATSLPFLMYYSLIVKPLYMLVLTQLLYSTLGEVSPLSYGVLLAAGLSSICVGTLGAFIQMSL
jgi:NADH-quinone oxidoreductase subunit N